MQGTSAAAERPSPSAAVGVRPAEKLTFAVAAAARKLVEKPPESVAVVLPAERITSEILEAKTAEE